MISLGERPATNRTHLDILRQQDGDIAAELIVLAERLDETVTETVQGIYDIVNAEEVVIDQPSITQADIDRTTADLVPDTELGSKLNQAGRLFTELDKPERRRSDEDGDPNARLYRSVSGLIFTDIAESGRGARRADPFLLKSRRLIEFCDTYLDTQAKTVPFDKLAELQNIARPVRNTDAIHKQIPRLLRELDSAELGGIASAYERVAPNLDLGGARLLVFSEILRVMKRPEIMQALDKLANSEALNQVVTSPYGPYYETLSFVKDALTSRQDMVDYTIMLKHGNLKGRFGIPTRGFGQTMDDLLRLGSLYANLTRDEALLHGIPANAQHTRRDADRARKIQLKLLTGKGVEASINAYTEMTNVINPRLDQTTSPEERAYLWEQAQLFDNANVEVASWFKAVVDALGIDAYQDLLEYNTRSRIDQQQERISENRAVQELLPEIQQRLEAFYAIEQGYYLSNTQFRQRHAEVIPLAKQIGDRLSEQENVSTDSLRTFAGLLLSVYWERTGNEASISQLVQTYLEDAAQLRTLSHELEYLGQPQSSRLLNAMNLLDELIESGFFDQDEFEGFAEFVLEYLNVRDGEEPQPEPMPEEPVTEEPAAEDEPPIPAVPVETIGQADYEDIRVFPPGSTTQEVIHDYVEGIPDADMPQIEWERIVKLIELRDQFTRQNLEVNFIRTKHASWQVLPFFVMEVRLPGQPYAVAVVESPVYGNATYIYREAANRPEWREVVQLERHHAREFGAEPKVHVDGTRLDIHFRKLWNHVISDLTIRQ